MFQFMLSIQKEKISDLSTNKNADILIVSEQTRVYNFQNPPDAHMKLGF